MIFGFRLSVTPVVLTFLVGLLFVTVKWKSLLTKKSRFLRPNPRLFLFAKFSQDYFQDFSLPNIFKTDCNTIKKGESLETETTHSSSTSCLAKFAIKDNLKMGSLCFNLSTF